MHQVDLSPLYQTINEALLIFLTGLASTAAGAVGLWLQKHFKLVNAQTDAQITGAFNTALQNGVQIAMNSLEKYEGEHSTVAVKGWVAEQAAQYAVNHNADFVKRFTGVTPDDLAKKALAYVQPIAVADGNVVVNGTAIALGKPTPANVPPAAATAALNQAQAH